MRDINPPPRPRGGEKGTKINENALEATILAYSDKGVETSFVTIFLCY